jgi:hydroxymethylbilane synthase
MPIPEKLCLPAVGQGALGIETRSDDDATRVIVATLDHGPSRRAVIAERAFLARLGGGCLAPATAHAVDTGDGLEMNAMVGDPDGKRLLRDGESGPADDPVRLGERLAERLLSAGAGEILREVREEYGEIG